MTVFRKRLNLHDFGRRLREALRRFPEGSRAYLLHLLSMPEAGRAAEVGRLYQDGRRESLAELLIDLEADPDVRAWVREELLRMQRP